MQSLFDSISFLRELKANTPDADKAYLQAKFIEEFGPRKARSVFVTDEFALRFSEARTGSFSNTVLSLSALRAHDARPFVVVVTRQDSIDFLLANTTLLKKISHSSLQLRADNIKGSFNGTDILSEYEGLANAPDQFEELFALHSAFTWEENVERLVEATNAIIGRDNRFQVGTADSAIILAAPERAAAALASAEFGEIERELVELVETHSSAILDVAQIENVNLRGNAIEQLLTGEGNAHELGDLTRQTGQGQIVIDIKTKLLDRASAPKAYNIDKMLAFLAEPGSVFAFFMVGVETSSGKVVSRLLPVLESTLIESTTIQHHWAGRTSRGVTQLTGNFGRAADPDYQPVINEDSARAFLEKLLAL